MRWPEALLPEQAEALEALLSGLPSDPLPMLVGAAALRARLPVESRLEQSRDVDVATVAGSWAELERELHGLSATFDVDLAELRLRHGATGAPIDLVPYGGLEKTPGAVEIPVSKRRIVSLGMAEAHAFGERVALGRHGLILPTLRHLLVLKLVAWGDRRDPKDVEDVGRLMRALPATRLEDAGDAELWTALAEGRVGHDVLQVWSAGRSLRDEGAAATRAHLVRVLDDLAAQPLSIRRRLVIASLDVDVDVERADRGLVALRVGLAS